MTWVCGRAVDPHDRRKQEESTGAALDHCSPRADNGNVLRSPVAALVAAAAVLLLGGPASVSSAGATPSASARSAPQCQAADLTVARGRTEAATSHRYTHFRVTNDGAAACRLGGFPRFQFRNATGTLLGWPSSPSGTAATVVLQPGHHTRVTVGRVVVSVVPKHACHPRRATSIDVKLHHVSQVWNLPYKARVCTTRKYRPESFPIGS